MLSHFLPPLRVVVLSAIALPSTVAAQPETTGIEERHHCAVARSRCEGTIRVPLNWSDPHADSIDVAFVWLPRTDTARPALGTILGNFGGPEAAIPYVPRFQQILGPVLERRNLLVVDPRGLGASTPLRCPPLKLSDFEAIEACASALGPRVQFFTSDQIVADMDAVRAALGVERVALYGNSFGTVLAHAYATRFPGRTEAVYFDSMVLIGDDGYVRHPIHRRTDAIELVCSRSRACRDIAEGPAALLDRLVARLRSVPDERVPIAALPVLLVGANTVGVREFTAASAAYLSGDPAPLRRLTRGFGTFEDFAIEDAAGHLAIVCGDARYPFDRGASAEERKVQFGQFLATARPLSPFERGDFRDIIDKAEPCLHWPTPRASPPVLPGAVYPRVPVLAAAGDFDTRRPVEVEQMLRRFPETTLLRVRYGGHALAAGSSPHNMCVRSAVRAFFENPRHSTATSPERESCDAENFRALGSFPRESTELQSAESAGLPEQDRRLVSAAFATASDLVARRNPLNRLERRATTEAGLRGGEARWDPGTRTITLDRVRFVVDLEVTGTIRLDAANRAVAHLTTTIDGQRRSLEFNWRAFVAEDITGITGRLDDVPFSARIIAH